MEMIRHTDTQLCVQVCTMQDRSQILHAIVALSYDPGQAFMQAAATQLGDSPEALLVGFGRACDNSHERFDDWLCCLQLVARYLQAAVIFGYPVPPQLLAKLNEHLSSTCDLPMPMLSAYVLRLTRLSCLRVLTWMLASQSLTDAVKTPGASSWRC